MRTISASHLPGAGIEAGRVVAEAGNVRVVATALDAAGIDRTCSSLLEAQAALRGATTERVVRAIDSAAHRLLDPAEPARADVLASLHEISGFSPPMASLLLDRIVDDWRAPALDRLIRTELGGPAAIDSFIERGPRRVRAVAPQLGLHVFSGNVPGVGVTSIVRALLVRSAVLAKSAAAEPVLAPTFARLLAEDDPSLGRCVAVTYWPGGDAHLENAALARVGLVVHYGGGAALTDLRARAPAHVRFVEHGPRISFAVVRAAGAVLPAIARDLARAVALFDQQGCVSPQTAWVIGTREQARILAAATATALDEIQRELPRGRLDPGEAAAIRAMRTRAEFADIAGRDASIWGPPDLAYSVILADDDAFEGTCLNRTLLVKQVPDLPTLLAILPPFRSLLQTVGLAGFAGDERVAAAAALADTGVTRISTIGDMPWPPPTWHHDGRGPLQELVRWVDLED
ncbi:MAG TPA: acyl-CoA reductase [Longimicrobiales bacterium]